MLRTTRGDEGELRRRLDALQRRVAQLEAQLEALDASFVRHQGQNEDDLRRAEQAVDRVGHDLTQHLDAHWRSR
jgi:multidrug resistance efflux pump